MKTAMDSIKSMVDVNTVVGDPVETPEGSVIIPVTRVSAGFAAGGGEYDSKNSKGKEDEKLPFGGGSGAGVSVQPVGFLVVGQGQIRLLPVDGNAIIDRLIDVTPQVLHKINQLLGRSRMQEEEKDANSEKNNEFKGTV